MPLDNRGRGLPKHEKYFVKGLVQPTLAPVIDGYNAMLAILCRNSFDIATRANKNIIMLVRLGLYRSVFCEWALPVKVS